MKQRNLTQLLASYVEHYYRGDNEKWQLDDYTEGVIPLKTLPFELNIEDIYFKVDFNDPLAIKDPDPII